VGTLAGVAYGNPANQEPKEWSYGNMGTTAVIPEAEPNDVCPGQPIACGDEVNPASLIPGDQDWYFFSANAGQTVTIATDAVQGSTTDTYLELYFGCGTAAVATDDDGGPGLFSLITYPVPASGQYQVKCRGFSSSTQGLYKLLLTCVTPPPPPENDQCNDGYAIDRCSSGSLEGDVSLAANDYNTGSPSCTGYSAAGRDVAYRLDLQAGDVVDLVYTQLAFDGSFYVITDCNDSANTCVIGADATLTGEPEVINWVVGATGTYWLILDVYGTNTGGEWTLDYAITCPPTPTHEVSWGSVKSNFR
jgi:hypothetical protein